MMPPERLLLAQIQQRYDAHIRDEALRRFGFVFDCTVTGSRKFPA